MEGRVEEVAVGIVEGRSGEVGGMDGLGELSERVSSVGQSSGHSSLTLPS